MYTDVEQNCHDIILEYNMNFFTYISMSTAILMLKNTFITHFCITSYLNKFISPWDLYDLIFSKLFFNVSRATLLSSNS